MSNKPKVLVGMSGGVDSSLSAALLLEQGYEVIGGFMKNWSGDVSGPEQKGGARVGQEFEECGWKAERRDAMRVAAQLGIPFVTFDLEESYRKHVVDYMFREYESGRTPNPDVMCNKFMKFDLFLKEADKLGCDFIATGHYARVGQDENGNPQLLSGLDPEKDQSYFLCQVPYEALRRTIFPIGEMVKSEVRNEAKKRNLVVAEKKDSQGICFVGEVNMNEFLKERLPVTPGPIITTEGEEIGQHEGIHFYTIGQRKGMGIGGGTPYYVVKKDIENNTIIVSSNYHELLYSNELRIGDLHWLNPSATLPLPEGEMERVEEINCKARIRYRQPLQECEIKLNQDETLTATFPEQQRAVTPGQFIAFYQDDVLIGSGVIQ